MTALLRLFRDAFNEWYEDKAPTLGAALAYYSVFSLAPLGVLAMALAGMAFGEQAAKGEIMKQLQGTVGPDVAAALEGLLRRASSSSTSRIATLASGAMLLVGAMGVFTQLQDSFNTIWKVKAAPGRIIVNFFRYRLLSFAIMVATGILLLAS